MALSQDRYEAMGIGAVGNSAVYFGVGYLYGALTGKDRWMAAQVLAIYALANTVLNVIVDLSTGGRLQHPKIFYTTLTIGEGILGILQILALRRLQLIGAIGTIICSVGLYARTLYHLHLLNQSIQS